MKDLLLGTLMVLALGFGFYWATRFCIWAYVYFGEFVYGAGCVALLWAFVAGAKKWSR